MSEANDMLQIAKVLKSNGTDGGVLMSFRDIDPEDLDIKEPVFIEFDGLPVPFFIESLDRKGSSKAVVHLTDIDSFEAAEEIVGQAVWSEDLELEDEEDGLGAIIGWTLVNAADGEAVGIVTDYMDQTANVCLEVDHDGTPVLVPIHEDLIGFMDAGKRIISVEIPDGLLDL